MRLTVMTDGECTFYQNALRSEVVSNSKLTSVEGQTKEREGYSLCVVKVLCPWLFLLVSFFCRFCLKPAMHSGKMYMHHYGQFGAQGTLPPLNRLLDGISVTPSPHSIRPWE